MIANFIWGGQKEKKKYHLSRLSKLTWPKNLGGWGTLDLHSFRRALLCESMWKAIMGESIWSKTIRAKYMGDQDTTYWYRQQSTGSSTSSYIWRGFERLESFFRENLIWNFQSWSNIIIRLDTFAGAGEKIYIPSQLLRNLHNMGYFFWASVIQKWDGAIPIWKFASDMQLQGALEYQWNAITASLNSPGLFCTSDRDCLTWKGPGGSSVVQAMHIYLQILLSESISSGNIFPPVFWKTRCPLKIIIFSWLVFHDQNLTWENLQKRNSHGPTFCPLCRTNSENNLHLFLQCPQV